MMAVKIDTRETVPPHLAIAAGLGGKANPSHKCRTWVSELVGNFKVARLVGST